MDSEAHETLLTERWAAQFSSLKDLRFILCLGAHESTCRTLESEFGRRKVKWGKERSDTVLFSKFPLKLFCALSLELKKPYSRLEREFHGVPIKSSHNLLELHSFILSWISPNGDLYLVLSG